MTRMINLKNILSNCNGFHYNEKLHYTVADFT